jgi:hypothetical protein
MKFAKIPKFAFPKKPWVRTILIVSFLLVLFPFILYAVFRSSSVQTWVAGKVSSYLAEELKADISIKGVDISWFMKVSIEGVYLSDQRKDTILYIGKLSVIPNYIHIKSQDLDIHKLILEDASIHLRTYQGDSAMNVQFLVDYFTSTDTAAQSPTKPWKFSLHNLDLRSVSFRLDDDNHPRYDTGMDFSHLNLSNVNLALRKIKTEGDTIALKISNIAAMESSGFKLRKFSADARVSATFIDLKNLLIQTERSDLGLDLRFSFDEFDAFNDFIDRINIAASFLPSHVDTRDITYFATDIWGMNNHVLISGDVSGKVSNMKLRNFNLEFGATSRFQGNLKMTGLPYIEETFINLDIKDLSTNTIDIQNLNLPGGEKITLPQELANLGKVNVKGKFTGFYNDFVSYAHFRTDLGKVSTDMSLKNNHELNRFEYKGTLKTENFFLGKLLGVENIMRNLDMNVEIQGVGKSMETLDLTMKGTIDSTDILGKTYREIDIAGAILNESFTGSLDVNDPDLGLSFQGMVDFNKAHPTFHFESDISHARLNRMHLIKSDTMYEISAHLNVNTEGLILDSMEGRLNIDSLRLKVNATTYSLDSLSLDMLSRKGDYKELSLRSSLVNANISGALNFRELQTSLSRLAYRYLPALIKNGASIPVIGMQDFKFDIFLKDPAPITSVFLPGISIARNTTISGAINDKSPAVKLDIASKQLNVGNYLLKDFYTHGKTAGNVFILESGCKDLNAAGAAGFDSLAFLAIAGGDSLNFRLKWNNLDSLYTNRGNIGGGINFSRYPQISLAFRESNAIVNDSLWEIAPENLVVIDSQYVHIENLVIRTKHSKLAFSGTLSKNPLDMFTIDIEKFNISNFDMLTASIGFDFDGQLNGQARIMNIFNSPNIVSDFTIKKLGINGDVLGDAVINSSWDSKESALYAGLDVIYKGNVGENQPIKFKGHYYPSLKKNSLDFTADLSNFRLKSIQNLLSSFSSKLTGIASGHMTLTGTPASPELNGKLKVQRGEIKIDYLNTTYSFSHDVLFTPGMIEVAKMTAYDSLGNQATIDAKIMHHHFARWSLDIDIQPKTFLSLNTRFIDNNLFYGKAFASGRATIKGPVDMLAFDIKAIINKGTQFFLPLNLTADIGDKDYITFITKTEDSLKNEMVFKPEHGGLTMNFDLEATPDGEVHLYLPYDMGNIRAKGEGILNMKVDAKNNFTMLGEYKVTEGNYLFTLKNLFSRNFNLIPGGRIIFSGDIYSTKLDLRAGYDMDVSLSGLKPPGGSTDPIYEDKVPVNCIIDLKGSLFNPEINFKLIVEDDDPQVNRIVYSQIDTTNQQQMSEQMIFLLVLKQFKPIEPTGSVDLGVSAAASSYEMLASQLSGWLSQISDKFDIGVSYVPGDQVTTDELTVALSTKLFNERVKVDGNFGMASTSKTQQSSSQNASNIVGDVSVEYLVTPDGQVYIKGYNKSNNSSYDQDRAPYTQGFGIFYRREFDHIRELFKRKQPKKD